MSKFYFSAPETVRVNAGGRYADEWFDLSTSISYDAVMAMGMGDVTPAERVKTLAYGQIVAHSLLNTDSTPLVLTREMFGQLPFELIQPLVTFVNGVDFLAQLSAPQSLAK